MSASSGDGAGGVPARDAGSALARISLFLRRPDVSGIVVILAVKVMMVVLSFTLIALAARALDTEGFGYYSILFSAAGLFLIVAAAGQELFAIRSWNEFTAANDQGRIKGIFLFSTAACAGGSAVAAVAFMAWAWPSFGLEIALAVTAFLVSRALLQISMHFLRAAVGVAAGDGVGEFLLMTPAILYLAVGLLTGTPATIAGVFWYLTFGTVAGFAVHVAMMWRRVLDLYPDFRLSTAVVEWRKWLGRSMRFWASNSLEAVNQFIDVLIIGYLMSPAVAGAYFVMARLANLFAAAADAINLFVTRYFSSAYFRDDRREVEQLLDSVAWISLTFICLGMVGIAVGGYFVLLFINEAYAAYFPELLILCLGTAALATARPCAAILMLTGHEGRYLKVIAATVGIRTGAMFLLTPVLGVLGAVLATTASFVVAAVAMRRAAKATTGLDVSIVRLTRKRAVGEPA